MEKVVCQRCAGTGFEPDNHALGARHKAEREALGLSLRAAGVLVGVSAAYLSDLERGNRTWNTSISKRVHEAYEKAGK